MIETLKVGKAYITRHGHNVMIVSNNGSIDYPYIGNDEDTGIRQTFMPNGMWHGSVPVEMDLVVCE